MSVRCYSSVIFNNCHQHLTWNDANATFQMSRCAQCDSFTAT
jgi:hypothetical protein